MLVPCPKRETGEGHCWEWHGEGMAGRRGRTGSPMICRPVHCHPDHRMFSKMSRTDPDRCSAVGMMGRTEAPLWSRVVQKLQATAVKMPYAQQHKIRRFCCSPPLLLASSAACRLCCSPFLMPDVHDIRLLLCQFPGSRVVTLSSSACACLAICSILGRGLVRFSRGEFLSV